MAPSLGSPTGQPRSASARDAARVQAMRFLQIEPTTRCNMTCGFCAGRHMPPVDLDLRTFAAALDAFPEAQQLELQGEGESLLHPQFFDMAAHAGQRGLRISFITNGSLFSPDTVERILDAGFDKVMVSLDSLQPETFRRLRGAALPKVLDGLGRLAERKRARGLSRPVLGLTATILRSTLDEIPALLALGQRLGLDGGLGLQVLNPMEGYARHYPPELADQVIPARELDAHLSELRSLPILGAGLDGSSPLRGFFPDLYQDLQPGARRCPWLEHGAYVTAEGFVTACCMIKDVAAHALGKIGVDSPTKMAAGRDHMRQQIVAGQTPSSCRGCATLAQALEGNDSETGLGTADAFEMLEQQSWAAYCRGMALQADLQTRLQPLLAERRAALDRLPALAAESASGVELRLAQAEEECRRLAAYLANAHREVAALRASKSWWLTAPLRRAYEWTMGKRRQ